MASAPPDALPVATAPAPGGVAAAPAAGPLSPVMQRPTTWTHVGAWLRLAYTDRSTKEHHILLEWIIFTAVASVVMTVLQHDPALDEQFRGLFFGVEVFVLAVFGADYALNLHYAPSRRRYAFSRSGIVDLLAILPSVLLFVDLSAVTFLRALRLLRFLRILQVAKAIHHRAQSDTGDENRSLVLDLQLGVILIAALLLLVPDDALRNFVLAVTIVTATTTGLRRWLVYKQRPALAAVVLTSSLVAAMLYAVSLDVAGRFEWAVGLIVVTVLLALVTWLRIEAPAGAL